jgi:hypothetical protein
MRAGVAQGGIVSPVLFSLCVNDIPTPSRHVQLAQYADDAALIATSRNPSLLIGYLEAYLGTLELWLQDWRITINVSRSTAVLFAKAARPVQQPTSLHFLGEPIEWCEIARYPGDTLDMRLTWSVHVNQVRKKSAQRLGKLGPLVNRRSGLSVGNGVLLYRQLVRPMMDYACPIWRSAAFSHVRMLQVLKSKRLRIVTDAPLYVCSKQIHEDLGIPFFADLIRAATESFD